MKEKLFQLLEHLLFLFKKLRRRLALANLFDYDPTSYVSQFMTLLPGDVISTGTPAGVGLGMRPPQYLKAGDVVQLGIDLGESRQRVVAWQPTTADMVSTHQAG